MRRAWSSRRVLLPGLRASRREDADIGAFEAGRGENVDDSVVCHDGAGDKLADGGVDFFGGAGVAGGFFGEGGADGLEEGDVVVNFGGFVAGGAPPNRAMRAEGNMRTGYSYEPGSSISSGSPISGRPVSSACSSDGAALSFPEIRSSKTDLGTGLPPVRPSTDLSSVV